MPHPLTSFLREGEIIDKELRSFFHQFGCEIPLSPPLQKGDSFTTSLSQREVGGISPCQLACLKAPINKYQWPGGLKELPEQMHK